MNNILNPHRFKSCVLIITILIVFLLLPGFYHSIHISYGNAKLDKQEFSGKIIFYKDDFFKAIGNSDKSDLHSLNNEQFDQLKQSYLKNHLTASANGNMKLELILWGNSEDESSIWFYFKFESPGQINFVNVKYDVLFNEFSNQMNLLNIMTPSGGQSLIFSSSRQEIKVQL